MDFRHEWKHEINYADLLAIRQRLTSVAEPDAHARNGIYRIRSDFLAYQIMGQNGVAAPLCSYVYLTVNGEDWGLYLAVEGIEDAFLKRNYGDDAGKLYKPDSSGDFGGWGNAAPGGDTAKGGGNFGGWGNTAPGGDTAKDGGNFGGWGNAVPGGDTSKDGENLGNRGNAAPGKDASKDGGSSGGQSGSGSDRGAPENNGGFGEDGTEEIELSDIIEKLPEDSKLAAALKEMPEGTTFWSMWENLPEDLDFDSAMEELEEVVDLSKIFGRGGGGGRGGMDSESSEDVKLKYIDDDPDSYPNIFNNAKTKVTTTDKQRLIKSLKKLNQGEDIEKIVDVEQVIRYFALHNFICNGDSYTGGMVHNYYLYEKDGKMSMIPWDYNLAFGDCFNYDATAGSVVNSPVDSPVTEGFLEDRPMAAWIFRDETWLSLYHQYYREFVSDWLENGKLENMIDDLTGLIAPYVEKDPTKSCTYEEFEKGVSTLKEFCRLRTESVKGQLDGTIPSTKEGQETNPAALVDASGIDLSDMGGMVGGGWGGWSRSEDKDNTEESRDAFPEDPAGADEKKDDKTDLPDGNG